jgi:signal transduction histidine kinase
MSSISLNALINLLGFALGAALYGLLLMMVLRNPVRLFEFESVNKKESKIDGLLLITAILGLIWNVGELFINGARGFGSGQTSLWIVAASFTALGFLPAVVVHSAWQVQEKDKARMAAKWITLAAYSLSTIAGIWHFGSIVQENITPSQTALRGLTVGYVVLIGVLFFATRKQTKEKRVVWAAALAVFAISALHLSQHHAGEANASAIELIGHHASLPLALAILYQDFRFAFADLFLKRALSLLLLACVVFALYVFFITSLLKMRDVTGQLTAPAIGGFLILWIATALLYPRLQSAVVWFVDTIILRRTDYAVLRNEIAQTLSQHEHTSEMLDVVSKKIIPALSARNIHWTKIETVTEEENFSPNDLVRELDNSMGNCAQVFIPTAEPPYYDLTIGSLSGGRRLLSDDIAMLESVAVMTARRIDALRVTHERCEQTLREQEIGKLATEAQLKALRAQINPHFLFNALTTIGYLIKTSPERALDTLMRLTELLRGVLRSSNEFMTLGEELKLIASYLDIEKARFEERLNVSVDVNSELYGFHLPSLLIQPIVENAIKHGIAPSRVGGNIKITATLEKDFLVITVEDTGVGISEIELARNRSRGVGLNNVEQRLRSHFGSAATLKIKSTTGKGAVVRLRFPAKKTSKEVDTEFRKRA